MTCAAIGALVRLGWGVVRAFVRLIDPIVVRVKGVATRTSRSELRAALIGVVALSSATAVAQEKVAFPAIGGDTTGGVETSITGFLFRPGTSQPTPAVVGLHGCDGLYHEGRIKEHYVSWAGILNEAGYALLLVDSLGSRGFGSVCPIPVEQRVVRADREMPRDAYGALNYLQS
jgi:poly(3-hydroxybutyrate) depolymerase